MEYSRVLLHQRTLSTVLQVDAIGVEVSLRGDDHYLRHSPGTRVSETLRV